LKSSAFNGSLITHDGRLTVDEEKIWASVHESGHALATVRMFRDAEWLPHPMPELPVKYLEISQCGFREWNGNCLSKNIYSSRADCFSSQAYRDLMERQVIIELAGGVAESIYRDVPLHECNCDTDRKKVAAVLGDLYFLTGVQHTEPPFIERTRALLQDNWYIVQRMAKALGYVIIVNSGGSYP
jgi:hypothetical protein